MARLLTTIEKVRAYKDLATLTIDDDDLADLIERVSDKIMDVAQREFVVDGTNPQERVFDVTAAAARDRELEIGDLADVPTTVTITDLEGTETVADLGAVTCLPRRRESWQPIAALRFELHPVDLAAVLRAGFTVTVAADWGFPEVPPRIVHETIKTVYAWLAKDIGSYSKLFKEQNPQFAPTIGQHALPLSAQQEAERFRVPLLGSDED
jgi:hypothetical protein